MGRIKTIWYQIAGTQFPKAKIPEPEIIVVMFHDGERATMRRLDQINWRDKLLPDLKDVDVIPSLIQDIDKPEVMTSSNQVKNEIVDISPESPGNGEYIIRVSSDEKNFEYKVSPEEIKTLLQARRRLKPCFKPKKQMNLR